MTCMTYCARRLGLALALALAITGVAGAQTVTTGTISGTVQDQQGGRLPGATVSAVHVATGTAYQAVTQTDGYFSILNVRVGTYNVKVTLSGFKESEQSNIIVALGEERVLSFPLEIAAVAETVTVVADTAPINLAQAGTGGNISNEIKEVLPTITRTLQDLVRMNVYFNPNGFNEDTPNMAVAGRSQRYNSLQIDGAVNNDLFGLASSGGVPGGVTGTAPISLDAIEEIQLVVSPYDIRQSGFSGGGINAITKTGTNQLRGTAFYFTRDQDWVGKGITDQEISTFSDTQMGFSLGGPVVANRAFFFGTVDIGRKDTPSGFSVSGTGVNFATTPEIDAGVDRFLSILRDQYGYDLGPTARDEFTRTTDSDKIFVRTDLNLGPGHQLTIRHNYVNATNDVGFPSATAYRTPDNFYRFESKTNSTVGQLTSRFGSSVNELRVALTRIRDHRLPQSVEPRPFPMVEVTLAPSVTIQAGRENFSAANELDQDILEITNDFTFVRGQHTLTVGTHNEFFQFRNLFIRDNFGNYQFNSLDFFEQGLAQSYNHSFSATSDPRQAAEFSVNHMGFYAGDQWRARSRLTMSFGTRVDVVRFPDAPNANPATVENFGFRTDIVPNNVLWSPRVGVNWDRKGDGTEQVRGGVGIFAGRPPYVWVSNQFGNTGIDFTRIGAGRNANNRIPFVADAAMQPKVVTGASAGSFTNEIDLVHPDFKYPSLLRGNLAYDRQLPFGLYGTVELLWSNTLQDIRYENLNLVQIGTQPVDGRPRYSLSRVPTLSNVLLLANTTEGSSWSLGFDVRRPFASGFFISAAYLYGDAKTVADGTRDQAASVWGGIYTPGDPNNPPVARSDYSPGHRFTLTTSYDVQLGRGYSATASVFYSGQSGRPYSLSWGSSGASVNGDGQGFNDLLYLPASADELAITGANRTYADLADFFDLEDCYQKYIGQIFERNACRAPWSNTLDGRIAVTLPFRRVRAEVTLDMLNMINLFDSKSGVYEYASFNQITTFTPVLSSGVVTGMNIQSLSPTTRFTRSDLRSRWQMQLGGRIKF